MPNIAEPKPQRGLDVADLRPCRLCGKGMMHDGDFTFYEIDLKCHAIDVGAVRQIHAMEALYRGNAAMGRAMAPNAEISKVIDQGKKLICAPCMLSLDSRLVQLIGD